jgi:ketosteroid isomerase-like protein
MRRTFGVVIAVILSAACGRAEAKFEREADAARGEIVEQIRQGLEATRTKDVERYLDQIPDDIPVAGPDGQPLTREAHADLVRQVWDAIAETRALDVVVDTIVYHGDSATVLTTTRWDRLIRREGAATLDTVLSVKKQSETWRRTPKGWRAYGVRTIGGTTTVNGELVLPGGR